MQSIFLILKVSFQPWGIGGHMQEGHLCHLSKYNPDEILNSMFLPLMIKALIWAKTSLSLDINYDMKFCPPLVCYAPDAEFFFFLGGGQGRFKTFLLRSEPTGKKKAKKITPSPQFFFMKELKITKQKHPGEVIA